MFTIAQAQRRQACIFLGYARVSPWNSKTRREWIKLARNALNTARSHPDPEGTPYFGNGGRILPPTRPRRRKRPALSP